MKRLSFRQAAWLPLLMLAPCFALGACLSSTHEDGPEDLAPNAINRGGLSRDSGAKQEPPESSPPQGLQHSDGGGAPGPNSRPPASGNDGGAAPRPSDASSTASPGSSTETCSYDGKSHPKGSKFTSKDGDCQCVSKGNVVCWNVPNKPDQCLYNGTPYRIQQVFTMPGRGQCACYADEALTCG